MEAILPTDPGQDGIAIGLDGHIYSDTAITDAVAQVGQLGPLNPKVAICHFPPMERAQFQVCNRTLVRLIQDKTHVPAHVVGIRTICRMTLSEPNISCQSPTLPSFTWQLGKIVELKCSRARLMILRDLQDSQAAAAHVRVSVHPVKVVFCLAAAMTSSMYTLELRIMLLLPVELQWHGNVT